MNPLDIAVLAIIGFNLLLGLIRGFASQFFRLLGLVAGVAAAGRYGGRVAEAWPAAWGLEPGIRLHLSWLVIFLAVTVVALAFTHLVRTFINRIRLGSLDRFLGTLFGAAKGALIMAVLLYFLVMFEASLPRSIRDHVFGDPAANPPRAGSVAMKIQLRFLNERIQNLVDRTLPEDAVRKLRTTKVWDGPR